MAASSNSDRDTELIRHMLRYCEDASEAVSQAKTAENGGMVLNLALNYGFRAEMVDAVKHIAADVSSGRISEDDIDEKLISSYLYTKDVCDPDLIIRTSGEQRLSNFLMYQAAYSELYFTDTLWPDFGEEEFTKAMIAYAGRQRRYGKVDVQ